MADVTVDDSVQTAINQRAALKGPYWTSESVGYIVTQDEDEAIIVLKTANKGASWAEQDASNAPASTNNTSMAACFDQETKGNTGTLIRIAWQQHTDDEAHYIEFDTASDTFGTDRTTDSLTVDATNSNTEVSICVAKSGKVVVSYRADFDGDTENTHHSMRSSSDGFATNNESEKSPYTSAEERMQLMPGAAADEDDICATVMLLGTANSLEFWKFDASANSWSTTAIDTDILISSATSEKLFFDTVSRHSDEHILCVYFNDFDDTQGELRCVDVTQATPTITAKTNLHSDVDDSFWVGIMINQQNDDVYAAYLGSDAGDEVINSELVCYYKLSTDGMGIWSSETTYGVLLDDLRAVSGGHSVGNAGGRWMPAFFNTDLNDVLVNDGNDIEIAAVAGITAGEIMAATSPHYDLGAFSPATMVPY